MPKKSLDTISKNKNYVKKTVIEKPLDTFDSKKKSKIKAKSNKSTFKFSLNRIKRRRLKIWSVIALVLIFLTILLYRPVKSIANVASLFQDGKYLILFQNNAELRGGGGFLGSFAVIDIKDHKLKSYYFEANIYKKDTAFIQKTKIPLPAYFREKFDPSITSTLRDANYPSDFSSAGSNVAKYYNLEYGEDVNGIIAVNASLMEDLLKIIGPVKAKDGTVIDSNNFFTTVQTEVEGGYFAKADNQKTNEPKSLLKDMVPTILSRVKHQSPIRMYHFVLDELKTKNILFWFNDSRETKIAKLNWGGIIPQNNNNLIYVSNNNIGGEKTSLSVQESLNLTASKASRQENLLVTRAYTTNTNYQHNRPNQNYTKVFLPLGSNILNVKQDGLLLSGKDYTVDVQENKTVVGFWTTTQPGQVLVSNIDYIAPDYVNISKFNYVKQPGIKDEQLSINLDGRTIFNNLVSWDLLIID